jgi:hypothetical protein
VMAPVVADPAALGYSQLYCLMLEKVCVALYLCGSVIRCRCMC